MIVSGLLSSSGLLPTGRAQSVRLISVPDGVFGRVLGVVSEIMPDGTVSIRTEKGNVLLTASLAPKLGQQILLDVPKGISTPASMRLLPGGDPQVPERVTPSGGRGDLIRPAVPGVSSQTTPEPTSLVKPSPSNPSTNVAANPAVQAPQSTSASPASAQASGGRGGTPLTATPYASNPATVSPAVVPDGRVAAVASPALQPLVRAVDPGGALVRPSTMAPDLIGPGERAQNIPADHLSTLPKATGQIGQDKSLPMLVGELAADHSRVDSLKVVRLPDPSVIVAPDHVAHFRVMQVAASIGGEDMLTGLFVAMAIATLKRTERPKARDEGGSESSGGDQMWVKVEDPETGDIWDAASLTIQTARDALVIGYGERRVAEGREGSGRIFVLETTLSRIGRVQVHGRLRGEVLSLLVVTQTVLPDSIKTEIADACREVLPACGFTGTVAFRVSDTGFSPLMANVAIENVD
jgi:hypothetical protein